MDGDKPRPKPRQDAPKTADRELNNIAEDVSAGTEDLEERYEDEYSDASSIRSSLSEPDEALNKVQRSIKVRNILRLHDLYFCGYFDIVLVNTKMKNKWGRKWPTSKVSVVYIGHI